MKNENNQRGLYLPTDRIQLTEAAQSYMQSSFNEMKKLAGSGCQVLFVSHYLSVIDNDVDGQEISRRENFYDLGLSELSNFDPNYVTERWGFPVTFAAGPYSLDQDSFGVFHFDGLSLQFNVEPKQKP
jgi:hypothetical protein